MSISIPGRVIVFDYGEVISRSQSDDDRRALVEAAGGDAAVGGIETFWAAYWAHRDDLDHGTVTVPGYWARVGSDLGLDWTAGEVAELWARDFRSWISVEPGTVELLDELHAGGTRMAILSNAGFDFGDPLRRAPYGRYFERVFVSAELGMLKPHADVYEHVAGELGIGFDAFVFIDNKEPNVDAAVALGATGHHFTGVDGLREFLMGLAAA
ncbi:MAG: HAD-IA family hydrolase [Pseudolysinimonas sp.]